MKEDTFTINTEDIDVTKIMEQIRRNINERDIPDEKLPELNEITPKLNDNFNSLYNKNELEQNIALINMYWNIILDKPITSHRRHIGKFIVFGKRVIRKLLKWHVESLFGQQIDFNASVTRTLNEINNYVKKSEDLISNYKKQVTELISIIDEKDRKIANLEQSLIKEKQDLSKQINEIKENINMQNFKEEINLQINKIRDEFNKSIEEKKFKNNIDKARLKRLERQFENIKNARKKAKKLKEQYKFDYLLFENQYRGKEKDIIEKQKTYLQYFEGKQNVLDIGCGRGEFLELLNEKGIACKGIDINEDMYLYCKRKGLNVEKIDMLEYLEGVDDHSLGGIFLGQVIEHLPTEKLIKLVRLSYEKLQPGGFFVAETINPQCLLVFTESYFLDPYHIKMIHPLTIKFILEAEGFTDLEIKYMSKVDENLRIPQLKSINMEELEDFNNSIEKLNNIIYGYRDYAIIGRK